MSGPMREKEAEDYDLERFIEMFDSAMNSRDPRVQQALRQLMMMVILTDSSDHEAQVRKERGPLQQIFNDINDLRRRVHDLDRRMLQAYPLEKDNTPKGYNISGQGGSLPPQWPSQDYREADLKKWNLDGIDSWKVPKGIL